MLTFFMIKFLILLTSLYSYGLSANCAGCCQKNGGVICLIGITICKDETPLTRKCLRNKCNKCQGYQRQARQSKSKKIYKPFLTAGQSVNYLKRYYQRGGESFFCKSSFDKNLKFKKSQESVIFIQLISIKKNKLPKEKYLKILADPINLVPVRGKLKNIHNKRFYGEINGSKNKWKDCHLEITPTKIEPRNEIKGDISRVIRYLEKRYQVTLVANSSRNLLSLWELEDPINTQECQHVFNHSKGKLFGIYRDICE
jgi:hypothetical protein